MNEPNPMNESNPILAFVVLDDGETYSRLEGCSIVITTREEMLRMDRESGDIRDLRPLYEIGLANVVPMPVNIDSIR